MALTDNSCNDDWLKTLISSHKQKLAEIRTWEPKALNNTSYNISLANTSVSLNRNNYQGSQRAKNTNEVPKPNSEKDSLLLTRINFLEHKLSIKKSKIKTLKNEQNALLFENEKLKTIISELEVKNSQFLVNAKKDIYSANSDIEKTQELLNKINLLEEELELKNEQISKISKIDELKLRDIENLNQKCKDMELISEENSKEYKLTIEQLQKENQRFKNYFSEYEKMFEIMNYFIKRVSMIFPQLIGAVCDYQHPKKIQGILIAVENSIFQLYNEYNSIKNKVAPATQKIPRVQSSSSRVQDMEEKIKKLTEQNLCLEKKVKAKRIKKSRSLSRI